MDGCYIIYREEKTYVSKYHARILSTPKISIHRNIKLVFFFVNESMKNKTSQMFQMITFSKPITYFPPAHKMMVKCNTYPHTHTPQNTPEQKKHPAAMISSAHFLHYHKSKFYLLLFSISRKRKNKCDNLLEVDISSIFLSFSHLLSDCMYVFLLHTHTHNIYIFIG